MHYLHHIQTFCNELLRNEEKMNKNIIGENIQKHRKELGITQAELAEMVQISTVHMSHIETGTASLSLSTLLNLCAALKVTPNDLLLGTYPLHFPDNDDQMHESPSYLNPDDILLLQQIEELLIKRNKYR